MTKELMMLRGLVDRHGGTWDLYLWRVNADWLATTGGERLTYWIEWVGVAAGDAPTREALEAAQRANRTVGLRVLCADLHPSHERSDLGHAFWFGPAVDAGNRPFVAESAAWTTIREQSMVLADALLQQEIA